MKRVRRLAAWCALVAVCFVQLVTAAHACAGMAAAESSPHCHEAPAPAAAEHQGLCLEHCNGDAQVVDHHSPVSAPAVAVVPLVVAQACAEPAVAVASRFAPDPAIPIPVFAASSRLRI